MSTPHEPEPRPPAGPAPSAPQPSPPSAGQSASTPAPSRPAPAPGPGWATRDEATTVLPGARGSASTPRTTAEGPRTPPARTGARPGTTRPAVGRPRRARMSLRRIDPWSVFLFSLVASVFVGIALVVAVAVLYAVLGSLGVTESLNQLYAEVTGGSLETDALLTSGRVVGGAVVLAAVNVVFLTLLATLSAMLFNLCASFTGGIELTFGERD